MSPVAGVDSSTQATKVVVVDPEDGRVVREARRAHPEGTEVDPTPWWDALCGALGWPTAADGAGSPYMSSSVRSNV